MGESTEITRISDLMSLVDHASMSPGARGEDGREETMMAGAERDQGPNRKAIADLTGELAALERMTVGELAARYRELFGEPTRSRNKNYLRKRLAWRIQELAEGGLSPQAQARIAELASTAPPRWRSPRNSVQEPGANSGRDPRIPPVGTVLKREYKGVLHEVVVLQKGFEYRGQHYPNLSRVARQITGTNWNGFLFWRLHKRAAAVQDGEA